MVKPHAHAKVRERDAAALDPDRAWADDLFAKMLAACHPYQRGLVLDKSSRVSAAVGRGGGKTTAARVRALRKVTRKRRARVGYCATSRPEAERLNWEPMKELLDQLGEMDNFEFSEAKLRLTCRRTGGTYQFFGADDKREVEKQRGQPYDEFQLDECASWNPVLLDWLINRAVGPRLGERKGAILAIGSPGHVLYGLFYDVTRPGSDKHRPYSMRKAPEFSTWNGWSSHHWNMPLVLALANAKRLYKALYLNWQEALRTKEREKWGDDNPIWLREYMGIWAADNTTSMYAYQAHKDGQPFNQWDPLGWSALDWDEYRAMDFPKQRLRALAMLEAAIAKLPDDLTDWLYGYGMDLGSRDPHALDVFAFSPTDAQRRKWHVCSFDRRQMYARLHSELLIGDEATTIAGEGKVYTEVGGMFGVTGYPAAIVGDLAALGESVIGELQNVYGITIKAAEKKDKLSAIELVNGDLVDGQMFVLKDSELERQLATLQWKPDENGQPKEDKSARNDHADAATYIRREIGAMFSAPPPKPKSDKDKAEKQGEKKQRTPKSYTQKPEPGERERGEFDSLLAQDNFSGLR